MSSKTTAKSKTPVKAKTPTETPAKTPAKSTAKSKTTKTTKTNKIKSSDVEQYLPDVISDPELFVQENDLNIIVNIKKLVLKY